MGVFAEQTIYQHLQDTHGGYNDEGLVHRVDYQEQVEVLRQAEEHRQRQQAARAQECDRLRLFDNNPIHQLELQWQRQVEEDRQRQALLYERVHRARLEQQRMRLEAWREDEQRQVYEENQRGWRCSIM